MINFSRQGLLLDAACMLILLTSALSLSCTPKNAGNEAVPRAAAAKLSSKLGPTAAPLPPPYLVKFKYRHPRLSSGLYTPRIDKTMIIVNGAVYAVDDLRTRIDRYANRIHDAFGCEVVLYTSSGGTAETLKHLILTEQQDLDGVVMIGDLPRAYYETIRLHDPNSEVIRIFEMEVYADDAGAEENIARNKPAFSSTTSATECDPAETPGAAFDGIVVGPNDNKHSKWCTKAGSGWLMVDLGVNRMVKKVVLKHAGAGGEDGYWNTQRYSIDVRKDGPSDGGGGSSAWRRVATRTENNSGVTEDSFAASEARWVRLNVEGAEHTEPHIDRYVSDVFFMDLDGVWEDRQNAWIGAVSDSPSDAVGAFACNLRDAQINFAWGNSAPPPRQSCVINKDSFSVRWTGTLTPTQSGEHRFFITADDGFRLQLDGNWILNQWGESPPATGASTEARCRSKTVDLVAGREYPIRLDYAEFGGDAFIKLEWETPNGTREAVPASALKAEGSSGLKGAYFNNKHLLEEAVSGFQPGTNGIYDRHTGDVAPEIFVARIDAFSAAGLNPDEHELLARFFDKDDRYWRNKMGVGDQATCYKHKDDPLARSAAGLEGSALVDFRGASANAVGVGFLMYDAVSAAFPNRVRTVEHGEHDPNPYLSELTKPASPYRHGSMMGHGARNGAVFTGTQFFNSDMPILFQDFQTCSPMQSHDFGKEPYAYTLGGAVLFGGTDAAKSNSIVATGPTHVVGGGNVSGEGADYDVWWNLAKGFPVGLAYKERIARKAGQDVEELQVNGEAADGVPIGNPDAAGNVGRWPMVGNMQGETIVGDPFVVLQEVPSVPRKFRSRFDVREAVVTIGQHGGSHQLLSFDHRYVNAVAPQACGGERRGHCLFRIVPGLANPSAISFESLLYPGAYLRHGKKDQDDGLIRVDQNDNSEGFLNSATFVLRASGSGSGWARLTPFSRRDMFLQIENGKVSLGSDGTGSNAMLDVKIDPSSSTNLAAQKKSEGSPPCAPSETADKAFNGTVTQGTSDKWCSTGGPSGRYLIVDLGASYDIAAFGVAHAGACGCGENAQWNTKAFTISVSSNKKQWEQVVRVDNNVLDYSIHSLASRKNARYVRLDITTPTWNGDLAARIYELEVFGRVAKNTNLVPPNRTINNLQCGIKPDTGRARPWADWGAAGQAISGFCENIKKPWAVVDLGKRYEVSTILVDQVKQLGVTQRAAPEDLEIVASLDGETWSKISWEKGCTDPNHAFPKTSARFLGVFKSTPSNTSESAQDSLNLKEVYGSEYSVGGEPGSVNPESLVHPSTTVRP